MFFKKNETKQVDFESIKKRREIESTIKKAIMGDRDAIRALFEKNSDLIFKTCLSYTRDIEDAKDLTQEVFIKAFNNLTNLNDRGKFVPWLMTLTRNTCLGFIRKKKKESLDQYNYFKTSNTDVFVNSIQEHNKEEKISLINEFINTIKNEEIKETVILFYQKGNSTEDIGRLLGIPKSTVTSRLDRFRGMVRKRLVINYLGSDSDTKSNNCDND